MSQQQQTVHPYIPNSVPKMKVQMLREIGADSVDELYEDIPSDLRLQERLDLPPPLLSEHALKRHVEVEERMMAEARALLEGEEDERVRTLLSEIYADEARHHAFLSNLLEAVLKRDLIFDEDVWAMIWRDVPTHGAPRDPYA